MNEAYLINTTQKYVDSDMYNCFPSYRYDLLQIVRKAIKQGVASNDQLEQLVELEAKLSDLPRHSPKSFLGSSART